MNNIQIFYEDIPSLKINKRILEKYIKLLVAKELYQVGNITMIFCSDAYLLEVNKQYLNHDYYTDIVTFDYRENSVISGDLFISFDRIKENAANFKATVKEELFRVVFHGVLHLIGYNDKTEEEQKEMRQKENFYLSEVDFRGIEL